jgi:cell division protein FtsQ
MDGQRRFARSLRIARRRFWSKLKPVQPSVGWRAGARASATGALFASLVVGLVDGGHITLQDDKGLGLLDWASGNLGYAASDIEISGLTYHKPEQILDLIEIYPGATLIGFRPLATRQVLEQSDWIKSANVQRIYPNRLKIEVVEHEPFAIWRRSSEYLIIDREGNSLSGINVRDVSNLPLVTGEGANLAAEEYLDALSKVQNLHLRTKGSAFVGGRRWTAYLDNGIKIMLPETDVLKALQQVEQIETKTGLLSKAIAAVDLRFVGRMGIQLPEGFVDEALTVHALSHPKE